MVTNRIKIMTRTLKHSWVFNPKNSDKTLDSDKNLRKLVGLERRNISWDISLNRIYL